MNTNLAAAAGVIGATLASLMMFKTIDVSQMGNGAIGGLVAITAPCAFVDYWAGIVIGLVAGLLIPVVVVAVEKLKIDDPLGALAAHGVSGIWGTLAIGLFGTAERMDPVLVTLVGLDSREGLLLGGGLGQLWVQFYGIAATVGFTGALCAIVFLAIKYTVGLRVSEEHEMSGLDISEHGMFGYPEQFIDVPGAQPESAARRERGRVRNRGHRHVARHRVVKGAGQVKKIEAFIRHEAFDAIRDRLAAMGLPSMSISEVKGSGRPEGVHRELPRLEDHHLPASQAEAGDGRRRRRPGPRGRHDPRARPHGRAG